MITQGLEEAQLLDFTPARLFASTYPWFFFPCYLKNEPQKQIEDGCNARRQPETAAVAGLRRQRASAAPVSMAIHTPPNQATFSPFLKTLQVFISPSCFIFFKPVLFFTPQTLEIFTPDAAWQRATERKGLKPLQLFFCLKKGSLEPVEAMSDAGVMNPLPLCGLVLPRPKHSRIPSESINLTRRNNNQSDFWFGLEAM